MKSIALRLYQSLRTETRPLWIRILQTLITICVIGFVYNRLQSENWQDWLERLPHTPWQRLFLLGVVLLIPLNLGLETRKWQCLIKGYYPQLRFGQLFSAVLSGMATGIFTPNRIGEYAGRIMSLPEGFRLEAGTHTLANRLLQMLTTLLMGSIGWTFLWITQTDTFLHTIPLSFAWGQAVMYLLWGSSSLTLFMALRPQSWLPVFRMQNSELTFLRRMNEALLSLSLPQILQALFLAVLRYAVFTSQYILLLYAFGYEASVFWAMSLVALTFLLKSLLPSIALTELGVRESIALWLMGGFGIAAFTIVSSTFLLYLCNVILPALLGLLFVYRIRA